MNEVQVQVRPPQAAGIGYAARTWRSADGLALFARDYPGADGPARLPVLCLHGLTRNSADFEDVAPGIAATGRRVLALDMRGRGRSQWDLEAANYNPVTYARDVLALLDAAGIDRAHFIGTSMGGLIAMHLAGMAPKRIAGAVLNDVGPELGAEGVARISGYVGAQPEVRDWGEAAAYARRTNAAAYPDYDSAAWERFARRTFREDEDRRPVLDYDPAISAAMNAGGPALDLWPLFRSLAERPLLLVHGALSDLLPRPIVEKMRAAAPAMEVISVPRVGHGPMLDEPEAREGLEIFLAALP